MLYSKTPPLQTLLKRGFTPTLKPLNQFLTFLFQARKFKLIIHLFSQANSNGITGNSETHSIFTWALLNLRKYKEAEQFMKTHMVKSSDFWNTRLWDTLIRGFCTDKKDPEKALIVLKEYQKIRGIILPSSFTLCSLIHGFSSKGDMSRAIEVLELMSEVQYPFDNFVCSSVLAGFCQIGRPEFAVRFFENAVSSEALKPNVVTYTALVGALCKLGRVNEVHDLVFRMEKEGVECDAVFFSSWICGYISEGLLTEVFQRNRHMVKKGISPDIVSYTVLVDGFAKLGDVEKAVGFLEKMRNGGLGPNLVTFTAIMLGFCRKGKLDEAFKVLKMVEDLGIEVDEFMYATLIDGCCMKGDFDCVFDLLDEMEKRGISPSIVTYNIVINGLCKFGRMAEAEEVSKGVIGDTITYSTLLHGYGKEENITGILETKKRLEEAGVHMDVVMCNILIKALFMVGAFEDAYMLYKGMPEKNLSPDSVTCCTMIHGYCKVGRIDEALEIFNEFRSTTISAVAVYDCLIRGLCNKGMADLAIDVFIELNEKDFPLDLGVYMMLIKLVMEEKGAPGISNLLLTLDNTKPEVYDILCNKAISFLCKRRHPSAAFEVLMVMQAKGSILTSKSYYLIIKGLVTSGNKWLSLAVLNNFIKEYGMAEPRVGKIVAFYLCLKDVNSARLFLEKMNVNSATVTLPRTLFKQLVKDGRVLDAYKLVVEIEDNLPVMDVYDYTYVAHGLCKEGYISEALDLLTFAKRKGIALNIVSYNMVISALCRQGCLVEAFRLFDSLEKVDLIPSEVTYAILVGALCREQFLLDATQLFKRMLFMGYKPDICVYNSLIDGYSRNGQMDEALKLVHDLEVKGLIPDEFTVSALINGCCHKGDMEGALEYFFKFKRNGISPDFLGFMYLIRGLYTKGRMEETRTAIREMLQSESAMELINKVDTEEEAESLESLLICLCEQGSIKEAVTVLNEVASIYFPPRIFSPHLNGSHILQKRHDNESFGSVSSDSLTYPEGSDLPLQSFDTKGKMIGKDLNHLERRSQFRDFNSYYSIVASLCSRGEVQKASYLAKELFPKVD
ncbi:pentatricopeptide repeat-containing protein At5g57250, mitochondrial isoform X1 [Morus notabilis]|uniref:pentatricopeptide repeat-containing protein At5g57250, mitochondrial isoform X1 n=1 Tax=Morus notabilis TaxID=981085 RepID=UPI000CED558B|nr:pentatricopeptide repeat-containing protein At5g57250, mitochondrial isoform X1 [Morus notabilis]